MLEVGQIFIQTFNLHFPIEPNAPPHAINVHSQLVIITVGTTAGQDTEREEMRLTCNDATVPETITDHKTHL